MRCKPQQERLAEIHYLRQGLTVYLPQVLKTRRHARQANLVKRPLFPGYLFLCLRPAERNWTAIASTVGAIGPVAFNGQRPPVPDWVIERLRSRENGQGLISLKALGDKRLTRGNRVGIALGDQDLEGTFLGFRDEERVVVLLDILQRQMRVVTPLARLKLA